IGDGGRHSPLRTARARIRNALLRARSLRYSRLLDQWSRSESLALRHLRVRFHQGLALRPPPRLPLRIAPSHPPPCHTPPLPNSPMGSGLRNLCPPASPPIVTPGDRSPPGVSSIARVSSTRADRARPMATPAPPSVGMLDSRWTRGAVEIE